MLLYLAGCGGGGGGGGGGGSVGSAAPVVYSGNSNAAVISGTNAATLVSNIFDSGGSAAVVAGLSVEGGSSASGGGKGLAGVTQTLKRASRQTLARTNRASPGQRALSGLVVNETEPCDGGNGSTRTTGELSDDDGTGTLTVTFNNCLLDGNTLNGQATFQVDMVDLGTEEPTDFTVSFSRIAVRGLGVSFDVSGSLRVQTNFGTNTETTTEDSTVLDNLTGQMTKTENLVSVTRYENIVFPFSSFTSSVTGRIFDSVHGFVDINTPAPLLFATPTQEFPGGGQLLLSGSGNRSVRVTALSATMATFALDLNGDGTFESNATLKWTDLSGPVGADLADTDGDGMHNSWETANGLDPNNPADAALDRDGEGASNLAEYQAGSDPNNPGSTPPVVGLSLSVQDTPDPVLVGGNLIYSIVVTNSSLNTATNVVLTDVLPASVNLTSPLQPTQGSCSGTTAITCNFGTIGAFGTASIVIGVITTTEGLVSNTASVTTSSFDPNTSDNRVTSISTVGQPVAGIQAQIDAATDGATILVGPGLYTGTLNIVGKSITLQSSAGPEKTIIHGNDASAIRIGGGGTIRGFTITGTFNVFAAGIELLADSGTLITGNVFDGIDKTAQGGFGTAITGNSASPIVERNIFRNNSCATTGSFPAVVSFFNSSSPVIVNNIFENNACQAIDVRIFPASTPAPQIANNTFVGNRGGIKADSVGVNYRNNVIVQNGTGLEVVVFGSPVVISIWENNLVFGNTINYQGAIDPTGTNGNISLSPMFINGAAGNYRLQAGSPAINVGSSVGAPSLDFDGTARPINGSWDIGAFEAP